MTDGRPPIDYASQPAPSAGRWIINALQVLAGIFSSFAIVFVAVFFGALSKFDRDHAAWWAGPVVLAALAGMGFFAYAMRRRSPFYSIGLWIGTGLGLLLAGLCIGPVIV